MPHLSFARVYEWPILFRLRTVVTIIFKSVVSFSFSVSISSGKVAMRYPYYPSLDQIKWRRPTITCLSLNSHAGNGNRLFILYECVTPLINFLVWVNGSWSIYLRLTTTHLHIKIITIRLALTNTYIFTARVMFPLVCMCIILVGNTLVPSEFYDGSMRVHRIIYGEFSRCHTYDDVIHDCCKFAVWLRKHLKNSVDVAQYRTTHNSVVNVLSQVHPIFRMLLVCQLYKSSYA